jgi:hypothetical protein
MICSAKPVFTEELRVVRRGVCTECTLDERPSIFITDKRIFSSERMLHQDYYRKGSVGGKISGSGSQGALSQGKLICGKPPVVK